MEEEARGGLAARGGGGALGTLGGTWAHGWSRGSVARVDGSGRENLGGKGEKFLATLGCKCAQFGTFRALTAVILKIFIAAAAAAVFNQIFQNPGRCQFTPVPRTFDLQELPSKQIFSAWHQTRRSICAAASAAKPSMQRSHEAPTDRRSAVWRRARSSP